MKKVMALDKSKIVDIFFKFGLKMKYDYYNNTKLEIIHK